MRVRDWPDAERPARYLGAQAFEEAVVLAWQADLGKVCLVWALPGRVKPLPADITARIPGVDVLVFVPFDFGIDGPGIDTFLAATPDQTESLGWAKLSRILGMPLPYWPHELRVPELMCAWQPGAPTVIHPVRTELDVTPLLRLSSMADNGSPVHLVLLRLVRKAQRRSTDSALEDLELLRECTEPSTTVVAAKPMPVTGADEDEAAVDSVTRRAGWLEVLRSSDVLAKQCVRAVMTWDGGKDLPFSQQTKIDSNDPYTMEWAQRLKPVARTALFEVLDRNDTAEALVDPETDAPALRMRDGTLITAIPQRLPATSPLVEVILSDLIWVRTENAALYPALRDAYHGLSWGYPGSGPRSLALLIYRLLADINSPAADQVRGAPDGLRELTETEWPTGTILTRSQLEAAQDG